MSFLITKNYLDSFSKFHESNFSPWTNFQNIFIRNIYNAYNFIDYVVINQKILTQAFFCPNHFLSRNLNAFIKLIGLDLFFPIIFSLGPWSGVILKKVNQLLY